jgi:hypothetical protein
VAGLNNRMMGTGMGMAAGGACWAHGTNLPHPVFHLAQAQAAHLYLQQAQVKQQMCICGRRTMAQVRHAA